jgi:hypothetical protein
MELANQIFFIAFALIGLGLFLSAVYQYRANKASGFSIYWPLSVGIFSLSSLSFGIALWTHKFFLTIAYIIYYFGFSSHIFIPLLESTTIHQESSFAFISHSSLYILFL